MLYPNIFDILVRGEINVFFLHILCTVRLEPIGNVEEYIEINNLRIVAILNVKVTLNVKIKKWVNNFPFM